jgi:hypothetical protein
MGVLHFIKLREVVNRQLTAKRAATIVVREPMQDQKRTNGSMLDL